MRNIAIIKEWNEKLSQHSLQYLGTIYPNSSSKQSFEHCQKGCVSLLEETYKTFDRINNRNMILSDISGEDENDEKDQDQNGLNKKGHKKRKESKIIKDMMLQYIEIFRKNIKTTINYASLQQAHNGVIEDFKILRQDLEEYADEDGNTLGDDALIMASMTASLF